MSQLDHKLGRDLWRMKTQALAIGLVIAVGVLMLVMMDGLVNSLDQTRQAYYERYRLADVFAPVQRAPESVLARIGDIDGVAAVEGRVVGGALIDVEGQAVPVRAQAVSLPDYSMPRLNDIYLAEGRRIDPRRRDEILLLEGFANAHELSPGDTLTATMNGARRRFHIAGLAQSPEFLYSAAPGELVPDDARFAVIWMSEESLAAAYDVGGAFNEALIALDRGAEPRAVIAALDRLLEPYGGLGAYGLEDQFSNRFVSEEISGLRVSSTTIPPIFMAVAAFLLYIVISRMIESERVQIGLLKAFGYSSVEIGAHYFKFVLVIAVGGALLGCGLGILSGQALAGYYQVYYKFPFLMFRVDPAAFVTAMIVSVGSASAGGLIVLRKVFDLTPAVAMRPPAPTDFSRSADISGFLKRLLDQPSRMVVRRLARQPGRAFAAVIGISVGMGLSVAMLGVMGGFDRTIDLNFTVVDRSDATVSFIEPLSDTTLLELRHMDGVLAVEPFRSVSAILRHGHRTHRGAVSGLLPEPQLNRAMTSDVEPIFIRSDGIILAQSLADKLDIIPGQSLLVEVREGRRPTLEIPVVGIAQTLIGAPAYMEISALNDALGEPGRVSGAYLRIDTDRASDIYEALKNMPAIAGVSLREEARGAFQELMDQGAGAIRYIMAIVAAIITFGIVYNSARIAFAERAHDLASLRVIGFSRGEAAFVLLGELGLITLIALPLGALTGIALAGAIAKGFSTDLYSIPAQIDAASIAFAALAVILAAIFSGWLVKRDVDRLDLVSALKSRE
ncbi:FtsX-like permease family protein [Maricaulis sp.]|uniref:ABC transporter permease n=1 Tax=Maricaulis sp. TaxID=1486257 RepID=UPI003A8CE78A